MQNHREYKVELTLILTTQTVYGIHKWKSVQLPLIECFAFACAGALRLAPQQTPPALPHPHNIGIH